MNKEKLVPIMETLLITAGEVIVSLIVIAVFLIIGKYDYTVLTGVILGSAVILLNFLFMAISINRAVDEALANRDLYVDDTPCDTENVEDKPGDDIPSEENTVSDGAEEVSEADDEADGAEDEKPDAAARFAMEHAARVQNISKISYIVRTFTMLGALVLALISGWFNAIATVIPMLMFRPIIMIEGLIRRKR